MWRSTGSFVGVAAACGSILPLPFGYAERPSPPLPHAIGATAAATPDGPVAGARKHHQHRHGSKVTKSSSHVLDESKAELKLVQVVFRCVRVEERRLANTWCRTRYST